MFSEENLSHFSPKNAAIWLSLAFQAGAINAGGYLACHRFVTHTTGFATLFGTEMAIGNWLGAFGVLSVPMFFLAGSVVGAIFVDQRLLQHQRPHYSFVLTLITSALLLIGIGGDFGFFGHFGEDLSLARDYFLLAILSLVSGLQNAMITSAFHAIVRTTHLTGLTTDLGIGLVRVFTGRYRNSRTNEILATYMRMGIIAAFVFGSFSAYLFMHFQYLGFLLPASISAVLLYMSLSSKNDYKTAVPNNKASAQT